VSIPFDPQLVTAFILALVRASAWLFVAPPFNTRLVPIPVKAGLAAALALSVAPHAANGAELSLDTGPFVTAIVVQALVGFSMGMIMLVLFQAVQAAGALVDTFAGFSLAAVYDPTSDTTNSVFGRMYSLLATTLLFATGGHHLLVRGFFGSFDVIPAGAADPGLISRVLTTGADDFLLAAIEIAGPVIACLFISELSMGLVARAAPSLNVFSLAFPIRVGVTLLVVALAIPLIGPAVHNLVERSMNVVVGGG
jgi:flagellar biosynthetic protein FliR